VFSRELTSTEVQKLLELSAAYRGQLSLAQAHVHYSKWQRQVVLLGGVNPPSGPTVDWSNGLLLDPIRELWESKGFEDGLTILPPRSATGG